jgi:hypothetical protein
MTQEVCIAFCPQKSEGTHNQAIEQFHFCQSHLHTAVQHMTLPFPYKRFRILFHVDNTKYSTKVDGIVKFKVCSHFYFYVFVDCTHVTQVLKNN